MNALSKVLVFKGGTVLKKVYFEDYRFSEDLDFTLLDDTLSNEAIFSDFEEVFNFIAEEANIALQFGEDAEHESGSINFYIIYTGPLGGNVGSKQVKIDITRKEILEFEPLEKPVFINYSDGEAFGLLCYPRGGDRDRKNVRIDGTHPTYGIYTIYGICLNMKS